MRVFWRDFFFFSNQWRGFCHEIHLNISHVGYLDASSLFKLHMHLLKMCQVSELGRETYFHRNDADEDDEMPVNIRSSVIIS